MAIGAAKEPWYG
ncbi:hypothetical protein VTH06DRAFT_2858 [Thermothelomyces fergusii]